ncbi:MAG: hypothetical protein ACRDC4_13055, partial [Plesiomonas sp.]
MAIMRVRGIGSKGVIKDLPSFELPPEAWSHSRNVRFAEQRIEKMGGYVPVLMKGMPEEPPLAILTRNNTQDQIYGTSNKIWLITGRGHEDVSWREPNPDYKPPTIPYDKFDPNKPVDDRVEIDDPNNPGTMIPNPDYNPKEVENPEYDPDIPKDLIKPYEASPDNTWYYTTLSNAIVMNNPKDTPQGLRPGDDWFSEIPGWGLPKKGAQQETDKISWSANCVRSYRNYLVALGMTEGAEVLPQRVRWSNVAYVNALPPDWIEDDEARDGGFNDLTDANGAIVDGVPLRDSFVIYTDKETYLMEYVGGIMIFSFKKLFSDSGILAPECAVEFEQKHFVIAKDDIFVHNGSSKQPVASGRMKQYLIDEISSVNPQATKVFAYTPRKEIWITYVGPGQTPSDPKDASVPYDPDIVWKCNKCAIWNWEWDTWYFYDIPDSYDINMCPPPDLTTPEWNDFEGDVNIAPEAQPEVEDWWGNAKWENYQWSEMGKDFIKRIPYIASPDKCLYTLDVGKEQIRWDPRVKGENSQAVIAELLKTHMDMDEAVENTRSFKFIRRIVPQVRGFGKLHCSVGGSLNSTQEPEWDNYQIYDVEEDDKIDAF